MSEIVIRTEGLGKRYRIGRLVTPYRTLRESLSSLALAPLRRIRALAAGEPLSSESETIWALRDVNLEVRRGEVLGIIGRNGAGKSTLLKVLARITEPTTGRVELRGRVGSLLEVGTGFHPELTGRENIYLNGAILGMRKTEIERRFDEIVAFAEIERFLDTPVKRYSSGMYVRLAFAVAAHMEPEILLIDEVLAVGDAAFQKKCLGKIGEAASLGRTVLFVSHQLAAITALTDTVLVVDGGRVTFHGATRRGIGLYVSSLRVNRAGGFNQESKDRSVVLKSFEVTDSEGNMVETIANDDELQIQIRLLVRVPVPGLAVGFTLARPQGEIVLSSFHCDLETPQSQSPLNPGEYLFRGAIPPRLLNELTYEIGPVIQVPGTRMLIDIPGMRQIQVVRTTTKAGGSIRPGVVLPYLRWSVALSPGGVTSRNESDSRS